MGFSSKAVCIAALLVAAGEVREPRLYQLIRQNRAGQDRLLAIEFLDSGAQAFVFTFG